MSEYVSQEFDDMDDFEDDFDDDKKNTQKNQEMSNRNLNKEFEEIEKNSFKEENIIQNKSVQDSFEENFEEEEIEEYKSDQKRSNQKFQEEYLDDSFEKNEKLAKQNISKNEQKLSKFHENKENLQVTNDKIQNKSKNQKQVYFDTNQLLLAQEGQPRTLNELSNENQKLFTELKKVNEKLTEMIDKKGYENLLMQIKQKKKTDFKNRPVDIKLKTYDKEIINNQKMIKNLEKDYYNYKVYQQKLDSTVLLNQIKQKIAKTDTKIKILRAEIHNQKIYNRKQANKLVKKAEQVKRKNDFKKIMIEVDGYMQKIETVQIEISKLSNLKQDLEKENEKLIKSQKELYQETEQMGIIQVNEGLIKQYEDLKKVKFKWKNYMSVSEHNTEQKITFLKRDIYALEKKIEDMFQKSEGYNQILENQHEMFQDFAGQTITNKKLISLNDFGLKKKNENRKKVFSVKQKKPYISSKKNLGRLEISRNKSKKSQSKSKQRIPNQKSKSRNPKQKRPQSKKQNLPKPKYQKQSQKPQNTPIKMSEQKNFKSQYQNSISKKVDIDTKNQQNKQEKSDKSEFDDSMDSLFDKKPQQKQQNEPKNPIQQVNLNRDDFQKQSNMQKEEDKDDLSMLLDKSEKKEKKQEDDDDFDFLDQFQFFE